MSWFVVLVRSAAVFDDLCPSQSISRVGGRRGEVPRQGGRRTNETGKKGEQQDASEALPPDSPPALAFRSQHGQRLPRYTPSARCCTTGRRHEQPEERVGFTRIFRPLPLTLMPKLLSPSPTTAGRLSCISGTHPPPPHLQLVDRDPPKEVAPLLELDLHLARSLLFFPFPRLPCR